MIELVDFNEIYGKGREEKKEATKRTRRAGGGKKKAEAPTGETSPVAIEEKSATPVTETEASEAEEKA